MIPIGRDMHHRVTLSAFVLKARKNDVTFGLHMSTDTESELLYLLCSYLMALDKPYCVKSDTFT